MSGVTIFEVKSSIGAPDRPLFRWRKLETCVSILSETFFTVTLTHAWLQAIYTRCIHVVYTIYFIKFYMYFITKYYFINILLLYIKNLMACRKFQLLILFPYVFKFIIFSSNLKYQFCMRSVTS